MSLSPTDYHDALKRGQRYLSVAPRATTVRYIADEDAVELVVAEIGPVAVPRLFIDEFADVPAAAMADLYLSATGLGLSLDAYDIDIAVPSLLSDWVDAAEAPVPMPLVRKIAAWKQHIQS
jgi:hypothetical protein